MKKKRIKKILITGMILIMCLGILTACGNPVEKFNSLAEMQAAMHGKTPTQEGFYYFDFELEGVKEAGRYEATKRKRQKEDKEYVYFRYSIWYDIEYEINGQTQKRKLVVTATDIKNPMNLSSKNMGLNVPTNEIENEGRYYFYWFDLENVQTLAEEEKEYLVSICEQAIKNRYQYSAK